MPQWTNGEQQRAKDFQRSAGKPEMGLQANVTPFGSRPQNASSNDSGDISWIVPAGLLNFPSAIPGIEFHEWHAAVFPVSSISHRGQIAGAKALAASIIDLLTSQQLLQRARAEFEIESTKTPYFSLVPADARPDIDLNRLEMEKYRAEMRRDYLNKTPRFN